VAAARARGIDAIAAAGVTEEAGAGLKRATSEGEERLGSASWAGVAPCAAANAGLWFRPAAGEPVGFVFADRLRGDAANVVKQLQSAGFAVEVLSGDRAEAVEAMAREAGIQRWSAGRKPGEKIARLEQLKASGRKVLMVGDGLNDAPALAAAHASLSPSSAADISQTAADAIFQGGRLAPVTEILGVARESRRMSLQNFALAVAYNIVFVPLAMAGLVTPLIAAVAMSASSISVTANAVRLRSKALEITR
jgi:Cu2+-exporting ATPase